MKTVSLIFDHIQGINPVSQTISSIGGYTSAQSIQVAEMCVRELIDVLVNDDKEETLAFKILSSSTKFTEKQLWVIAFELEKNIEFSNMVVKYNDDKKRISNAKATESKNKLTANKEASRDFLDMIKSSGKKLGDYYKFLKSDSKFKREFFSKKYTLESANAFISL